MLISLLSQFRKIKKKQHLSEKRLPIGHFPKGRLGLHHSANNHGSVGEGKSRRPSLPIMYFKFKKLLAFFQKFHAN